jgi:hypothetical protein
MLPESRGMTSPFHATHNRDHFVHHQADERNRFPDVNWAHVCGCFHALRILLEVCMMIDEVEITHILNFDEQQQAA